MVTEETNIKKNTKFQKMSIFLLLIIQREQEEYETQKPEESQDVIPDALEEKFLNDQNHNIVVPVQENGERAYMNDGLSKNGIEFILA